MQLPIGGGAYACSACCNQSLCNSFNTSADICNYQLNTVTSTSVAYKSTVNSHSLTTTWKTSGGTSTTTHSSSAPTTHSTPSASTRTTSGKFYFIHLIQKWQFWISTIVYDIKQSLVTCMIRQWLSVGPENRNDICNNSNSSSLCLFTQFDWLKKKVLHFDKFHEQESRNLFPSASS